MTGRGRNCLTALVGELDDFPDLMTAAFCFLAQPVRSLTFAQKTPSRRCEIGFLAEVYG